jgi:hypothetical protein
VFGWPTANVQVKGVYMPASDPPPNMAVCVCRLLNLDDSYHNRLVDKLQRWEDLKASGHNFDSLQERYKEELARQNPPR